MPAPSPLLGFNDNVKHRGQVFHIQTEDSGVKYPHVITHLFADGGRILKTVKTSYAEHLGSEKLTEIVRDLMKRQHRAMFLALRGGRLDETIDAPPASIGATSRRIPAAPALVADPAPQSLATFRRNTAPEPFSVPAGEGPLDLEALERVALGALDSPIFDADAGVPGQYAPSRPVAIFAAEPEGASRAEPTLDDVILQFLADDLGDGTGGAR